MNNRIVAAVAIGLLAGALVSTLGGCTPDVGQPNDALNAQRAARRRHLPPNYLNAPPGLAPDYPPPPRRHHNHS
jgi:hypothetical protein